MHNAYVCLKSYVLDLLKYEHNSKIFTQICLKEIGKLIIEWEFDYLIHAGDSTNDSLSCMMPRKCEKQEETKGQKKKSGSFDSIKRKWKKKKNKWKSQTRIGRW